MRAGIFRIFIFLAISLLFPTSVSAEQNGGGTLLVTVLGLRNDQGVVNCALYNSPIGFPRDDSKIFKSTSAHPENGHATCRFDGVPPGSYAVAILHDENANGKMDTNIIGIPREGWGFSNDAPVRLAPPSFNAAGFPVQGSQTEIEIHARYWGRK